MKKRLLLGLSLVPLALASCGSKGYEGVYSFQLGKNSGAHATASITLKNDDYSYKGKVYGKQMTIYGEMALGPQQNDASLADSSMDEPGASEEGEESENPFAGLNFSDMMTKALAEGVEEEGYYRVAEDRPSGRKHLCLGFAMEFFEEIYGEMGIELSSELIEQIIFSEIDDKKIYLQIPVSFKDLELQLYWYGTDIRFLSSLDGNDADLFNPIQSREDDSESSLPPLIEPVEPHEVGTKPTKEDIAKINETYPATHDGELYRYFYTVSLALTRQ